MPPSFEEIPVELMVAVIDVAAPKHVPEHNAGLEKHSGLVVTLSRTCKTLHVGLDQKIKDLGEELWYHRNANRFHRMAMSVMRGGTMEDFDINKYASDDE